MVTLQDIWSSSTGLLQKFGLMPTFEASWNKVIEEVYEYSEALNELSLRPKNDLYRSAAAQEMADAMVTLINALYASGILYEDIPTKTTQSLIKQWNELDDLVKVTHRVAWIGLMRNLFALHTRLLQMASNRGTRYTYDVTREFHNTLGSLIVVAQSAGLAYREFESAVEVVMLKNGEKSDKTHEVRNGQIKKIQPATLIEEN